MSRHRNLRSLINEDDYYHQDDDYDQEEEEEEIYVKPSKPTVQAVGKSKPAKNQSPPNKLETTPTTVQSLKVVKKSTLLNSSSAFPSQTPSILTQTLASRPNPSPIPLPPSITTPSTTTTTFDFSTPSPDSAILLAQRSTNNRPNEKKPPTSLPSSASAAATAKSAVTTIVQQPLQKTKAIQKRDEEDDEIDSQKKPLVNLVVVGHVDAGKSTLMGHLLYDLQLVSQRDMHAFERESKDIGKASFKYAWVLDEHEEERQRGVTIDVGVKRFETSNRRVVLLDAPGHRDYIPNMITGASQADSAFLVVPASAGEFETSFGQNSQTREHAILLHRLGLNRLLVVVNKMDTVNWDQSRFIQVKQSVEAFLKQDANFDHVDYIPVSGLLGDNLVKKTSASSSWYQGPTLVEIIDDLPPAKRPVHKPLRLVVTDAYKSMGLGANTLGGKIEAGMIRVGDSVVVLPLNEPATIKAIQVHGEPTRRAKAGDNCEVGLIGGENLNKIQPGQVLCFEDSKVPVCTTFKARMSMLPMLKIPLLNGSVGMLHVHACEVPVAVLKIEKILNSGKLNPTMVRRNEIADLILKTSESICIERADDFKPLSRLLLRINGVTVAAGIVTDI